MGQPTIKVSYTPYNNLDEFISSVICKSVEEDLIVNVIYELISKEETRQTYKKEHSYLNKENKVEGLIYQNYVNFIQQPILLDPKDNVFEEIKKDLSYLKKRMDDKNLETKEISNNELMVCSPKKKIREILKI